MHRLFIIDCREKNLDKDSYKFYVKVFRRRFCKKFQKPKKDQCVTCATFTNKTEKSQKDDARTKKEMNKKKKKKKDP